LVNAFAFVDDQCCCTIPGLTYTYMGYFTFQGVKTRKGIFFRFGVVRPIKPKFRRRCNSINHILVKAFSSTPL
jgi:hypothetical protein